jgi:hypothetical protein
MNLWFRILNLEFVSNFEIRISDFMLGIGSARNRHGQ